MNDKTVGGVHWSFWAVGAVALIWNVLGCTNFFSQMNAEAVAGMPESYRAIVESRPAWATGASALSVFGGALGGLLLLLRKSAAYHVFIASLLGVVVTIIHALGVVGSTSDFGTLMPQLMSLAVAALLVWYSKHAQSKGWTR